MDNQQTTKKFYKRWWFWGIIIIVFFYLIFDKSGSQPSTTNQIENDNQPAISTVPKEYQEIFSFSGNGIKSSEPFAIQGDRFKIAYNCSGELCQAYLYEVGSNLPDVIMNTVGSTQDETIIYGSGEYYIQSNTLGNFTMTIYDYK